MKAQLAFFQPKVGDPWLTASALSNAGDIQRQQGNLDAAQKSYEEAVEILKKANASAAGTQLSLVQLALDRHHPDQAEHQLQYLIDVFEKDQNAGEELGGYIALGKALLAEGKVDESRRTVERARKLTDLRDFPILGMPLDLLALRVKAAEAPGSSRGRNTLLAVQREVKALADRAHRIGFWTLECEARLALGEVESKLSPLVGSSHLAALSLRARDRGFIFYADQSSQFGSHPAESVAMNKLPR